MDNHEDYELNVKEDVKNLHLQIQQMNKKLEALMSSIDNSNAKINMDTTKIEPEAMPKVKFSFKKAMTSPLRKLTINTLSAMFAMADRSTEAAFNLRENFEDIAAEAKYKSKKRNIALTEQM
jgi:hypothetical protein